MEKLSSVTFTTSATEISAAGLANLTPPLRPRTVCIKPASTSG